MGKRQGKKIMKVSRKKLRQIIRAELQKDGSPQNEIAGGVAQGMRAAIAGLATKQGAKKALGAAALVGAGWLAKSMTGPDKDKLVKIVEDWKSGLITGDEAMSQIALGLSDEQSPDPAVAAAMPPDLMPGSGV